MAKGSCNAAIFAVPERAHTPHRLGKEADLESRVWLGFENRNDARSTHMMRIPTTTTARRNVVVWEYPTHVYAPEIWAIADAEGDIVFVHECETRAVFSSVDPVSPISDAISGGQIAQFPVFGYSVPQTDDVDLGLIEDAVHAAPLPSWITGTPWESFTDVEFLFQALFVRMQTERGYRTLPTMEDVSRRLMIQTERATYTLLWYRAASMIIHDHPAETAIPLVLQRFHVVDGEVQIVS